MKKNSILFIMIMLVLTLTSCNDTKKVTKTPEVNVTTIVKPADGLDLKLVGGLLQKGNIKNAADLEKSLNKEGGINNLDLNSDGKIDFINVSENDSKTNLAVKSFDLTTGKDAELTHLATIEVEKTDKAYDINLVGSETVYGNNAHYSSSHGISGTDMLLMYWMFSPNRSSYSHTPYSYGNYPQYYNQPRVVTHATYQSRTTSERQIANSTIKQSNTPYKSKVASPNVGKTSKITRTAISNSQKQQKSFQTRSKTKPIKKSGFTKTKTRTRTRSSRSSGGRRSDGNYKMDIEVVPSSLALLTQLEPVTYYWNQNVLNSDGKFESIVGSVKDTTQQVGFIAQDIERVFPLLVNEDEDGKIVDYDLLVAYLVKGMQEQQVIINKQQEQLNQLLK